VSATRRAAPRKRSLISTFFWVVVLLIAARLILLQCGVFAVPAPATPHTPDPGAASRHSGAPGRAREGEASSGLARHLPLGVPTDRDPSDDHLLDEHSFVISYNPTKRVPNWVGWRLDRSYLGHLQRRNDFRPDPALPPELYHVSERDYLHSGYDRGHLCPSADREDSPEDNSATFVFTNMEPQLHELNAGPWEKFERYERERAERPGAVLYIVAGGVFSSPAPTIGQGVAVPAANFKIIVVLADGQGPSDVSEETEVVSVLMPNQKGVSEREWTAYLTSVDAIEAATGYDFLSAVPEPVQRVIEARSARP
jgi:endonuclease G